MLTRQVLLVEQGLSIYPSGAPVMFSGVCVVHVVQLRLYRFILPFLTGTFRRSCYFSGLYGYPWYWYIFKTFNMFRHLMPLLIKTYLFYLKGWYGSLSYLYAYLFLFYLTGCYGSLWYWYVLVYWCSRSLTVLYTITVGQSQSIWK